LHVDDQAAALGALDAIRKKHHDATHHCWALRLGPPDQPLERYDDDGEPPQTAGFPILLPLRREGLLDVLVVVVRWFGGTKLGSGGLVRAYGEAAEQAVARSDRKILYLEAEFVAELDYADLGVVEAALAREAAHIRSIDRGFEAGPRLRIRVLRSHVSRLERVLIEATGARVRVHRLGDPRPGPRP
jgi:uncharacterized YigZ family protein